MTTKQALQKTLKGILHTAEETKSQQGKMQKRINPSDQGECQWSQCPIKRYRIASWTKNKT
jgi:hypothetical protein